MGNFGCFATIGPVMIGPSSSHTAGAVNLGRLARAIFGKEPRQVEILLHGSFAETYKGHGTDKALVAGLLNFEADDEKISKSFEVADKKSINIKGPYEVKLGDKYHPNSVKFVLKADDEKIEVIGSSIGGGDVIITDIDEYKDLQITGKYETLFIIHKNRPGVIRDVTSIIAEPPAINIAYLGSFTEFEGGKDYTVVYIEQNIPDAMVKKINEIKDVYKVILIRRI